MFLAGCLQADAGVPRHGGFQRSDPQEGSGGAGDRTSPQRFVLNPSSGALMPDISTAAPWDEEK